MPFNIRRSYILIKILCLIKGYTAQKVGDRISNKNCDEQSLWRLLLINTPVQLLGVQWAAVQELCVLHSMWCCWWPCVQSGRSTTDTSVSKWNFDEYWNSLVVSWSRHSWSFWSHPRGGKQEACLVANAFSGGVATQLSCMRLDAWNIRICVCQKLRRLVQLQAALRYKRKPNGHVFWRVVCVIFPSVLRHLVGWQEGHPARKDLGVGLLVVMIRLELCTSYSSSCHHHFHYP